MVAVIHLAVLLDGRCVADRERTASRQRLAYDQSYRTPKQPRCRTPHPRRNPSTTIRIGPYARRSHSSSLSRDR